MRVKKKFLFTVPYGCRLGDTGMSQTGRLTAPEGWTFGEPALPGRTLWWFSVLDPYTPERLIRDQTV